MAQEKLYYVFYVAKLTHAANNDRSAAQKTVQAAKEYLSKGEAMAKRALASSPRWNGELTMRLLRKEARQLIKPEVD